MENHLLVEMDEEYSPIARLIELGRQKKYVTIDDILHFFPEAEKDVEQLEEAFSALLSAGIAFVEDAPAGEPPENELVAVEEVEAGPSLNLRWTIILPTLIPPTASDYISKKSARCRC